MTISIMERAKNHISESGYQSARINAIIPRTTRITFQSIVKFMSVIHLSPFLCTITKSIITTD